MGYEPGSGRAVLLSLPICCFVSVGCASASAPPKTSVAQYIGTTCPEDRVRVLRERDVGDDTVYVVEACGSTLEVERGYPLPTRRSEVIEVSAETPLDLPPRVKRVVPRTVTEIVRRKIQRWCKLRAPSEGNQDETSSDEIAFYSATPEEQATCREHLAQSLSPLGTEPDPVRNTDVYWYALGQYVFTTSESLYEPSPEHRSIAQSEPSSPASPKPIALPAGASSPAHGAEKAPSRLHGRIELGFGYLRNITPEKTYDGISWDTRAEAGLKLDPQLGLTFVVATTFGFAAKYREQQPYLFQLGLGTILYPDPSSGVNFAVHGGVATRSYGFDSAFDFGPLAGASLGVDFGARGKESKAENWTGGTLQLRSSFAWIDGDTVGMFGLHGGIYHW
jgi:hypothetical protein